MTFVVAVVDIIGFDMVTVVAIVAAAVTAAADGALCRSIKIKI